MSCHILHMYSARLLLLPPCWRVFWSHPLVAVREEEDNSTLTDPLVLTGADELIDNALRVCVCVCVYMWIIHSIRTITVYIFYTCALLWKSPNWASQTTRELGLLIEKPSSKPSTANSLRELLHTVYLAWFSDTWDSGLYQCVCVCGGGGRRRGGERKEVGCCCWRKRMILKKMSVRTSTYTCTCNIYMYMYMYTQNAWVNEEILLDIN